MPFTTKRTVSLSRDEKQRLESLRRCRSGEKREVVHAGILLDLASGMSDGAAARSNGVNRHTVAIAAARPRTAIALTTDSSILTAVANDYGFERVFARQIEALARPGDVAIGLSTSGNSANVLAAMKQAANQNLKTIGLSGKDGGFLARASDVSVTVPAANTARIQECHIAIGHIWCELVEFDPRLRRLAA